MKKEIHIFDLDDTLTLTPTFADFVNTEDGHFVDTFKNYSQYFQMAITALAEKAFIKKVAFKRLGDFVVVYDRVNDRPCDAQLIKYFTDKKYSRIFDTHDGTLVLKAYPGFHGSAQTLGLKLNEDVYKTYKAAINTMILTGRDEKLRADIEQNLSAMKIKSPNYGLKLYSGNSGIKNFKAATILETIKNEGWEIVHFYEDRQDWLNYTKECVNTENPTVEFISHLITNVHDGRSL